MTEPSIVFDVSRLATRFSRMTPNGIDRVDLAYARHFFGRSTAGGAVLLGPFGPRLTGIEAAREIALAMEGHWREGDQPETDPAYLWVKQRLESAACLGAPPPQGMDWRRTRASIRHLLMRRGLIGRQGLWPGRSLIRHLPRNALYLNVSQFPIWVDWYFGWLSHRPDVKAVFFLHDLLPIEFPEFFPPAEAARHVSRLKSLASRAAGVIVASEDVRRKLRDFTLRTTQREIPTCLIPLPPTDDFIQLSDVDPEIARHSYFVVCGTIEPRKNHLLLLHIWRELAAKLGEAAPKLVIVGARGWDNENVVDMLERCPAIRAHVIEIGRLSTPGLRNLLRGARALLMPSFAEGYGLPVVEALAVGTSVIASDIESFRALQSPRLTRLDPTDGPSWRAAILAHLGSQSPCTHALLGDEAGVSNWSSHFDSAEQFLRQLWRKPPQIRYSPS